MKYVLLIVFTLIGHFTKNKEYKALPKSEFISVEVPKIPKPNRSIHFVPNFDYQKYKERIGYLESRGKYNITNTYGNLGKYQFSPRTLKGLVKLNYLDSIPKDFLNNPEAQEEAMKAYTSHSKDVLKRYGAYKYIGKTVHGIVITEARLLAAAHAVGPYGAYHFVKTGSLETIYVKGVKVVLIDAYGHSVLDRIKLINV